MPIVLRTNGNEPYVRKKITRKTADGMIAAGHFTSYDEQHGYIDGDYTNTRFTYKGKDYKIEYFSGCFCPFLLQLNIPKK